MKTETPQANCAPHIVLASASPRRIDLMKNLGIDFLVKPSDLDEVVKEALEPGEIVTELAAHKAARVLALTLAEKLYPQGEPIVVLGSDTIVVLDKDVLGKPPDREGAIAMLKRLSGRKHEVYTGVCVLFIDEHGQQKVYQEVDVSNVYFRQLGQAEIENYVDTGEPMDKAGSYALQGIGAFLIAKIEGCVTNIIGLPVPKTLKLLRRCGINILGQ
jgi:septum formation protein